MDRRASQLELELASRLLAAEGALELNRECDLEALSRVFQKLYGPLAAIVGPAGNLALAERAMHLASNECPNLRVVLPILQENRLSFDGLDSSLAGMTDVAVRQGVLALLGNFLWLTSSLVGPDLTIRLIQTAWPAISHAGWMSGSTEQES